MKTNSLKMAKPAPYGMPKDSFPGKYLVVWTEYDEVLNDYHDFWETFDDKETAEKRYNEVKDIDDTYVTNLCETVLSTDYGTSEKTK